MFLKLEEINELKDKFLIKRKIGGLGDIFMHRMIFEDIKTQTNKKILFSCPKQYHEAIQDHPYIDEILDIDCDENYIFKFDTTNACNEYELKTAPNVDKHRSDIWAEHCGFTLQNHNMHIKLTEKEIIWGRNQIPNKSVLFMPISKMSSKNLDDDQIFPVINYLEKSGFFVFALHEKPLKFTTIHNVNLRQWMSIIYNVDYVISVDTAVLHCAGGMNKKMVGIFCWSDGKILGKYYKNMVLVQKHRDEIEWCGPCHIFSSCPKSKLARKPCITEITSDMIIKGFEKIC